MLRPLRTLVSFGFLALVVWGAFSLRLGRRTFAEHMDRIGETREAKELVDGTRSTIDPLLEEAKQRVLGEHVEAPTAIAAESVPASTLAGGPAAKPSTAEAVKLPGRRAR